MEATLPLISNRHAQRRFSFPAQLLTAAALIPNRRLPRFKAPPRHCDGSGFVLIQAASPAPPQPRPPQAPLTATPAR